MERYGGAVYAVCRQCLGDAHLAEDATQMTFQRLFRRAGKLRFACLGRYLKRTAKSVSRDISRKRSAISASEMSFDQFDEPARQMFLGSLAIGCGPISDERAIAAVQWAIEHLNSDGNRDAVMLHILEGCTLQGVADTLNISKHGLKKRLNRGIDELLTIMKAQGYSCSFALLALTFRRLRIAAPAGLPARIAQSIRQPAPPPAMHPRLLSPLRLISALAAIIALVSALAVAFLPRSSRVQTQATQQGEGTQQLAAASSPDSTPAAATLQNVAPTAAVST